MTTATTYLQQFNDRIPSVNCLSAYLNWVNSVPLLTEEEERDLTMRLHKYKDLEAARRLILSHLRLVAKIARNYNGYGLSQSDLIQEGNIGLMKAVKRFDPKVGVRLVSFAIHWIRAEIHEFILRNWRIVKIATTKSQRKLFFNIRKFAKARGWFSKKEIETVSKILNVSAKDVRQMEARLNNYDESFHATTDNDNDTDTIRAPEYYLESAGANPEEQLCQQNWQERQTDGLQLAIESLDHRSQDIVKLRWLQEPKATLHELADKYQISAERVRQLEKNAMNKIKHHMEAIA